MALRYYPVIQFFDDAGDVLGGGLIYTYITGTSTNKATYKDQGQATAHANPIVLDSDGRPSGGAIWLLGGEEYRFIIKTSADVTLQTIDDLQGISSPIADIGGYKQPNGLILSNAADADHDITISAGTCMDSTGTVVMTLAAITKQIDSLWAVGTNAGGIGPTLAASTFYHMFVIRHTDGTVDAGFDTSITAATLLTNSAYTYYRRIGSVVTDGSFNILGFIQVGDTITYHVPFADASDANPGTSAVTLALSVPPDVQVVPNTHFTLFDDSSAATVLLRVFPTVATDAVTTTSNCSTFTVDTGSTANSASTINPQIPTNTSKQVKFRLSASDADIYVYANTHGYRELF